MLKLTDNGKTIATAKLSKDLKSQVSGDVAWIFNWHSQVLEGLVSLLDRGPEWSGVRDSRYTIEVVR